ncbi:hypothetical protein DPMN_011407, partial [Dreissena polymorpha]
GAIRQACICFYSAKTGSGEAPTAKDAPKTTTKGTQTNSTGTTNNSKYQCEEYHKWNAWSFFDVEGSISSKRVGQPSSKPSQPSLKTK